MQSAISEPSKTVARRTIAGNGSLTNSCFLKAQGILEKACNRQKGLHWQIYTAARGQSVDASSGSSSYRVSISDQLLKTLQFRSMDNYRLAWLNAAVNPPTEEASILFLSFIKE